MDIRWCRCGLLVGALWLVPFDAGAQTWVPTDLGTLFPNTSQATAVNDNGTVVGTYWTGGQQLDGMHGFVWTAGSGWTDIANDWMTSVSGVNNAGQTAGSSWNIKRSFSHSFLRTASGGIVDVGELGYRTVANGINNAGQIVGERDTANGTHAFLWTQGSGMLDLGTLGGTDSAAYGINDAGQVAGESTLASGATHAFLWSVPTGMVDLGTLGGTDSVALGINNLGQVVGYARVTGGVASHAFRWVSGTMTDLGTLGGS